MEDLDKDMAAAEGMAQAEQTPTINETPSAVSDVSTETTRRCLNCETVLTDVFCPHCGQKDIPRRQTLGELLVNFIASFWSYESKFFQTGRYLLFRPGFLAEEYTLGRRERYYHPARMYVFISFVYFLLFSSLPDTGDGDSKNNSWKVNRKGKQDSTAVAVDSTVRQSLKEAGVKSPINTKDERFFSFDDRHYKTIASYDSAQALLPEEKRDNWFERKLEYREIELNQKYKGRDEKFSDDFQQAFFDNFSKVLFFLLPIFALLLKLLYVRRDFYYSEHLVFSIYYYNFFYLAGSIYMLLGQVPFLSWLNFFVVLWIFIYLLLGMKRMYRQSWRKTTVKFLMFNCVFAICVGIGFLVNLLLILMFI